MYRVIKALNHNAVLVLDGASQEYLIMGKGIGFGKKVSERIEPAPDSVVYSLQSVSERGKAKDLFKEIDPRYLEMADAVLNEAAKEFAHVDRGVLFPMADHIAFAVSRMRRGEVIANLLTQVIQVLFYKEFKAASLVRRLLMEEEGLEVPDDEIGYVALHVHAATAGEKVSSAMQIAAAVRECITMIEEDAGKRIAVQTLSYNRLMNHIRYMAARAVTGEELKLNMNQYISREFPGSYRIAETVCAHLGKHLGKTLSDTEIGYLAMHIERVYTEDE